MSERTEEAVKKLKALSLEDAEDNRCPETIKGLRCPHNKSAGREICSYHYRLKCLAEEREPRNILGRQLTDKEKELDRKIRKLELYQEVTFKLTSLDACDQQLYNSMEKQVQALSEVQKNSNQNEGYAKLDEKVLGKSPEKKRSREAPASFSDDPEKRPRKEDDDALMNFIDKKLDVFLTNIEKKLNDKFKYYDDEIERLDKEKSNKRGPNKNITRDILIDALVKNNVPHIKEAVNNAFGDKDSISFNGFQKVLNAAKVTVPNIEEFKNYLSDLVKHKQAITV